MTEPGVERFDVIVVGGGPGGSTTATLTARQGHRVLLLERARFPRYQIGESLLPSTIHGVCAMLGVKEELEKAGFMLKRGGTFRWGSNPEPWTFAFALSRKLAGPTSFAYQVDRERFDTILLENSRKNGVDVREEHEVTGLVVEGERVVGVRFKGPDGVVREARAPYVVVAAGNTDSMHKHVGERVYSEFFRNVALFGYYEGGKRMPEPNRGNILCAAFKDGWFWYIPLSETLTSVGAVVSRERVDVIQQGRETAMDQFIQSCPMIADYLADATRVTDGMYGELRVRKDYSYCNTSFWKPGIVLVGDSACFIDPVFSSGVHFATYSGVLAARSINTLLRGELDEHACFDEFERRYRREFNVFYQFLLAIYDLNRDEGSYFWTARKILGEGSTDIEAFVELVAGVSGPDDRLFSQNDVKRSAQQFGEVLEETTQTKALADGDVVFKARGTELLGSVMRESGRMQMRAALGADASRLPEEALFEGGLVPSGDGLHWARPTVAARS